ncbi:MAG: hypothetical protein AB8H03_18735, partial [Saprospiraceae bacterium]
KRVKLARLRSEELADTASILFADGKALQAVLKKYTKDAEDNILHPKREKRIGFILDKLKKFQV